VLKIIQSIINVQSRFMCFLTTLKCGMFQEFNKAPALQVLETLISVAYTEYRKVLDTVEETEQAAHLIQLLCSLQTSLFSWAHRQITGSNKEHSKIAEAMLVQCTYVTSVCIWWYCFVRWSVVVIVAGRWYMKAYEMCFLFWCRFCY